MSQINSNTNLIVSLPTQTKLTIDRLFQSEYSQIHLDKIYFLIHKINKEGQYQVNAKNHAWFFGMKCGEITAILHKLTNNNIIQLVGGYVKGKSSNKYALPTPYDIRTNNLHRINYYKGQVKFPTWVAKYVADGGIVKNSSTSNWIKAQKQPKIKNTSVFNDTAIKLAQKDLLIAELRNEVAELKALLNIQPEAEIKPLVTSIESNEQSISDLTIIARNGVELIIKDGVNFDQSTIDKIKKTYSKGNTMIPCGSAGIYNVDENFLVTKNIFKVA